MPKTGSSSLQRWIALNADRIRDQHGIHTVVAINETARNPTRRVHVEPFASREPNSGLFAVSWIAHGKPAHLSQRFADELFSYADKYPAVLITAEGLAMPFWELDDAFLLALDHLGRSHDVRVAYYVRPQHTAIEATWRERGYREPRSPSEFAAEQHNRGLHYLATLEGVQERAPHVSFEVRPFRADLLIDGSTVDDFVRWLLSLDEPCDVRENVGLPLELVNALRLAPEGMFWANGRWKYPRRHLRGVLAGLNFTESPQLRRSRRFFSSIAMSASSRRTSN